MHVFEQAATDPRKRWPPCHGECLQVPQQLEPEATTKSSNHISSSPFFPKEKYIKQKYTNTGATTQQLPLALPQPTVPAYAPARAAV